MRSGIWRFASFAAIALLAGARAARAQTPSSTTATVSAPNAANDAKALAQEHLDRGNALRSEHSFEKALLEFRAAYQAYPSPKIFYNEADAESELGHFVDAAAHYDAFLREFIEPEDEEDEQRIQAAREGAVAARAKIATIDPAVPVGVEVLVDARSFGKTPLAEPLRVDPGHHRVSFRRAGMTDSNRDVVLSPGQQLRVEPDSIKFPPEPPALRQPLWRRWPFWAAVGVTAVLGGVAAIYLSNRSDRPPCTAAFCVQGD
jgi:tetratricopeptide (TPR) repeat protein